MDERRLQFRAVWGPLRVRRTLSPVDQPRTARYFRLVSLTSHLPGDRAASW